MSRLRYTSPQIFEDFEKKITKNKKSDDLRAILRKEQIKKSQVGQWKVPNIKLYSQSAQFNFSIFVKLFDLWSKNDFLFNCQILYKKRFCLFGLIINKSVKPTFLNSAFFAHILSSHGRKGENRSTLLDNCIVKF